MDTQGLYIVTFVIGAVAVGTVTGLVLEYTQWRAGRRIYPLRHWLLRLLGGLLLLIILGMIFVGVVIMDFQNPFHFSLYWSVCLLLVFSLLLVVQNTLRFIDELLSAGVGLGELMKLVGVILPSYLCYAIPTSLRLSV